MNPSIHNQDQYPQSWGSSCFVLGGPSLGVETQKTVTSLNRGLHVKTPGDESNSSLLCLQLTRPCRSWSSSGPLFLLQYCLFWAGTFTLAPIPVSKRNPSPLPCKCVCEWQVARWTKVSLWSGAPSPRG